MWDTVWPYLTALLPTVIMAVMFYFVMRAILQGDHRERLAQSKWEAEQDQAVARPESPVAGSEKNSDKTPPPH